jgi:uncharacterized repeat protein (TIGR03803 family)
MKTCIKQSIVLSLLVDVLGSMLVAPASAQTFTVLHSFTALQPNSSGVSTNSDGASPSAGLVFSGNTLYGVADVGGTSGVGTVFGLHTDGTGFTNLYNFTGGSDGANPGAVLVVSGGKLYGTTGAGGPGGGTVFALNTDGTGFANLYSFTALDANNANRDGAGPGGLTLSDNTLYGTAASGGSSGSGTVFGLSTNGTGSTSLYSFTATSYSTNSDGANPEGGLISSGDTLYGTAASGGSSGYGTVFAVNTDGTGFRILHNFSAISDLYPFVNVDGAYPDAGLVLSGTTLYGTASRGGSSGHGTLFAVNTKGTGFTNLHNFTEGTGSFYSSITNTDGAGPGGLISLGHTLYGTAAYGGSSGSGTVFSINTDGSAFTTLHNFPSSSINSSGAYTNSDGAYPDAELILSGSTLYGTASHGGSSGNGTIFSISFPPQLTIIPSRSNIILSWPTNYAGFDYTGYTLQSTTNLTSPVWTTNLPAPIVVNGQYTVTNPISGTQQFFKLLQ